MKAVFTIEQVDGKLIITIEAAEPIIKEQDGIDWSKPVAFPYGYSVPKGTKVVVVKDTCGEIKTGTKGVTLNTDSTMSCDWGNNESWTMHSYELAPINPTDNPLHPNFKGNK